MARRNGRVKNSGTDNGTEDEEEGMYPDLPDLPIQGPVEIAK
jgi:hypothetical protein